MSSVLYSIIVVIITLIISVFVALLLPGFERKFVQARIQQRVGPPISSPGIFAPLKFLFKENKDPNSELPGFYNGLAIFCLLVVLCILLFTIPQTYVFVAFASDVAIVGLLKVEEISYVLMGSLSKSVMSYKHPFPDKVKGAKNLDSKISSIEDISSSRSLRLITLGSFPIYLGIFLPVIYAGSVYFRDIVAYQQVHGPLLFTFAGVLGAIAFFVGMMIVLNEYPFSFMKTKADVIEGPYMEYMSKYRAVTYITKGVLIFALSSLFSLLYLGVGPNLLNGGLLVTIVVAFILTFFVSFVSAFSPVFTNKQFYPVTISASIIGVLAMVAVFI